MPQHPPLNSVFVTLRAGVPSSVRCTRLLRCNYKSAMLEFEYTLTNHTNLAVSVKPSSSEVPPTEPFLEGGGDVLQFGILGLIIQITIHPVLL